MFGAWEGQEIAAFWFAVGAFILSLVAVGYTHAAYRRGQRRERERRRPALVARFDKWLSEPLVALFALENRGAIVVESAVVKVLSGYSPLVGYAHDKTQVRAREHDFGRLGPGDVVSAEFVLVGTAALDEPSVRFLATFVTSDDKWDELLNVALPSPGPMVTRR